MGDIVATVLYMASKLYIAKLYISPYSNIY